MTKTVPKLTLTQQKRLDILFAARQEFLESGFRDTNMDGVADRAQVSKRTLYNHFPSKEALFTAIASQIVVETRQATNLEFDPQTSLENQLTELAEREIAHVTSDEYLTIFRLYLKEVSNFEGLFDAAIAQTDSGDDPILNWIQAAMDAGQLKASDAELATSQFTSLLKGKLFWPMAASHRKPPSRKVKTAFIKDAVAMFLDHYRC